VPVVAAVVAEAEWEFYLGVKQMRQHCQILTQLREPTDPYA
jgi:hypothetical protein